MEVLNQMMISMFSLAGVGFLFGSILAFLDKKLHLEEDPLVEKIMKVLPGINCGVCGFAGCRAYAENIARSKDLKGGCSPGGEEVNRKLASLMGIGEMGEKKYLKVVVLCGAKKGEKLISFEYKGPKSCALAHISLGIWDCPYGCLGLGDCVRVCPTQALRIEEALVVIDYSRCIGCGKCISACPRGILKLVEKKGKDLYVVSCSNPQKGPLTKKVCQRGCIGCGICAKIIPESPFSLKRGLSYLDYQKVWQREKKELELVRSRCPVKIINHFDV